MFMANIIKILKKAGNDKIMGLYYDNFFFKKKKKRKKKDEYPIEVRLKSKVYKLPYLKHLKFKISS
jgi:hypothetical protein